MEPHSKRFVLKRGLHVDVYEKSRGIGGRLTTKRLEWGSIDIGAQYFTARDERFKKQVFQWQEEEIVLPWKFTPHLITASGLTTRSDITQRYVGVPGMNALAHALAREVKINFNTHIQSLKQSTRGWTLKTLPGETIEEHYDWVIVCLPAEQGRTLLTGSAIEHQITDYSHEPCWALALATRGHVSSTIQGIFGDGVVSWVSRLSSRPKRQVYSHYDDLWMLHFSGEWSKTHDKRTRLDLSQTGLEWLSNALESHLKTRLELVHSYKHYWRYARLKNQNVLPKVIANKSTGIAAIGDWSTGSRIEGAYLSAINLIDYIFEQNISS